jgi:tripartite-type tricarboxylate transporter receptor subunit TctC
MFKTLLCAIAVLLAQPAVAQGYPSQPIRMIAPFPPGGSVDIMARLISEPLARELGGKIVIDNRTGASGNIGMEAAARAKPDGYTIVLNTIPLATNQALFEKLSWDPVKDFAPIGMVATAPHVLVVPARVKANTVDELIKMAHANPGKLNYASAGVGTTFHLCAEMCKDSTSTFILHVPYRGGGPAIGDLLAGHVQLSFMTVLEASGHIKAGKLRALAVTSDKRVSALPEVPTLAEAALPGFNSISWIGLLAPAGTPREIVEKISADVREIVARDDVKDRLVQLGAVPAANTPAQFSALIDNDRKRYAQIIKDRKITVN